MWRHVAFNSELKAAVPPAARPVLRITMDVWNRSETVVSYSLSQHGGVRSVKHKCAECIHITDSYTVYD